MYVVLCNGLAQTTNDAKTLENAQKLHREFETGSQQEQRALTGSTKVALGPHFQCDTKWFQLRLNV